VPALQRQIVSKSPRCDDKMESMKLSSLGVEKLDLLDFYGVAIALS
jgi:hypothetical protein